MTLKGLPLGDTFEITVQGDLAQEKHSNITDTNKQEESEFEAIPGWNLQDK